MLAHSNGMEPLLMLNLFLHCPEDLPASLAFILKGYALNGKLMGVNGKQKMCFQESAVWVLRNYAVKLLWLLLSYMWKLQQQ